MSLYLDTSVVVTAIAPEPRTPDVQDWLEQNKNQDLVVSDWVLTEFSSALSLKVRTGALSETDRATAAATFTAMVRQMKVVPLDREDFHRAAMFCERHELGLRSGDALHLAVCAQRGHVLHTLDGRLARASLALGTPTRRL